MREILFRGRRLDNSEWDFGSLVSFSDKGMAILPSKSSAFVSLYDSSAYMDKCHEVDCTTVGQYTGLADKNGVKIFEGDIVSAYGYSGYVAMDTDYWEIHWNHDFNRQLYVWKEAVEIIGNIHDNPELLIVE